MVIDSGNGADHSASASLPQVLAQLDLFSAEQLGACTKGLPTLRDFFLASLKERWP
jgi:hypothetical protein